MELEDSPRPEVRALLEGGALRDGRGCGEDGGKGPTRVSYLCGAGEIGIRALDVAAATSRGELCLA